MTAANIQFQNGYPFLSKAQIKQQLLVDDDYVGQCARILEQLTGSREAKQVESAAVAGWGMSARKTARGLVNKLDAGTITNGEFARLRELVVHYVKQLARIERDQALQADPSLAAQGVRFGIPAANAQTNPEASVVPAPSSDLAKGIFRALGTSSGLRTEELGKLLKAPTDKLRPVLQGLVRARKVRRKGKGRGTIYSLA